MRKRITTGKHTSRGDDDRESRPPVIVIERRGVSGGKTRVYAADGQYAGRFALREPGSMLLMADARVIHETTPIHPTAAVGIRDTLVLTFRARGFQSPGA